MEHYLRLLRAFIQKTGRGPLAWLLGIAAMTVLFVSLVSSCARPPFTTISEPSYARVILESSLIAFNNSDYDTYLAYKHSSMSTSSSREFFDSRVSSIKRSFGDYAPGSAQFSGASFQYNNLSRLGYTVVYYEAKFTRIPARSVLVEIAFMEISGMTYVESIGLGARGTFGK